jgi:hypothetical protein
LEPTESKIKELIASSNVICIDETGFRIEDKRKWCHTYGTEFETFYFPHDRRGSDADIDIGVLPNYKGTIVHDGFKSYFKFNCKHALCNAHHLRELIPIIEDDKQIWALNLKDLLVEIKKSVETAKSSASKLDPDAIDAFEDKFNKIIAIGELENPTSTPIDDISGLLKKRGRKKQSKARNLLDRLKCNKRYVLAVLTQ